MSIYTDEGYESRSDYLTCMSEDYGVGIEAVRALAEALGPGEDFDGLVVALEDIEDENLFD